MSPLFFRFQSLILLEIAKVVFQVLPENRLQLTLKLRQKAVPLGLERQILILQESDQQWRVIQFF